MKKIILFVMFSWAATTGLRAQSDPLGRFFQKYEPDTAFTIVSISPKMFSLFTSLNLQTGDDQAQQIMEVAKNLTGLRIITRENAPNSMQLFREAAAALPARYDELMSVRDHGMNVKFMVSQDAKGIIHNLVMLAGGGPEFFAMSLSGNIDLKQLSGIAGAMNIQGFDKLKDLKKGNP
jgi:hypothetical protein